MHYVPKTLLKPLTLAVGLAATSLAFAGPLDSLTEEARDAYREGQIWATFVTNPTLEAYEFDIEVNGNRAVLDGTVETLIEKQLAQRIVESTDGIAFVDNRVKVDPALLVTTVTVKPERSFARRVNDAAITARVDSMLLWNDYTDGLDIDVDTTNGHVTLTGVADTPNSKAMATRLASNVFGVVSVDNKLVVDDKAAGQVAVAEDGDDKMSDTWIAAKVKSSLRYAAGVDAFDIKVESKDGNVMLTGEVDSPAERSLAIELAQGVRGVESVDARGLTSS